MSKTYRIGTRKSQLALAQTNLVKRKLESLTGDHFELVEMSTAGDQDTSKPLWQMDGKDFFTKELDKALLEKEVDLCVHSYKDLGHIRPPGIFLAGIGKRDFIHDILLIKKKTVQQLQKYDFQGTFRVGTSSPRRIQNISSSLLELLPTKVEIPLECVNLRGNIVTRMNKLLANQYDAIILAFAGLERLAQDQEGLQTLKNFIHELDYMILPLEKFPAAAAQGALAIECLESRDDHGELHQKIALLKHSDTIKEIERERKAFSGRSWRRIKMPPLSARLMM